MIFKSLKMQGFKSFADKTILEFPGGITAIVGPNGSGKSNVLDALRWVMGVQSAAELRGSDMDDVIFQGAEARREASLAEVTLTLADISPDIASKWGSVSELAITRRIYRTGEREFLINGKKSRRKDVLEVFFDSGIGAKSISIIEQEKIAKVVQSTPLELRYFLEETAGLVRYKERRKEAELRLKQTALNMVRIKDILSVLEEDLKRLLEAVKLLREYRRVFSEKTSVEKNLCAARYKELLDDRKTRERDLSKNREETASLISRFNELAAEEDELKRSEGELKKELLGLRGKLDAATRALLSAESDIKRMLSDKQNASSAREQILSDIKEANLRKEELAARIQRQGDLLSESENRFKIDSESLETVKSELSDAKGEAAALTAELREASAKYLETAQKLGKAESELAIKIADVRSCAANLERLGREESELGLERERAAGELAASEKELAVKTEAGADKRGELAALKSKLTDSVRVLKDIEAGRAKLFSALKVAGEQAAFYRKDIAARTKAEHDVAERFQGVLYTDHHKDEADYLEYGKLLVIRDSLLEEASEYVKGREFDGGISYTGEGSVPLLEARLSDGSHRKIADNFFKTGNIYVKAGAGEPGVILRQLEEKLSREESAAERYNEELKINLGERERAEEALRGAEERHRALSEELKEAENAALGAKTHINILREQIKKLEKQHAVVGSEIGRTNRMIEESEGERTLLKETVERLKGGLARYLTERELLEGRAARENARLEEIRERQMEIERAVAGVSERREALKREAVRLNEDLESCLKSLPVFEGRLQDIAHIFTPEWEEGFAALHEHRNVCHADVLTLTEGVEKLVRLEPDFERDLRELKRNIEQVNEVLHAKDKQLAALQIKAEQNTADIYALHDEVRGRFHEEIDDIWRNFVSGEPKERLLSVLNELEARIASMTSLNMGAEEEFEAKNTQKTELLRQLTDIENSVLNLNKVIKEIDENSAVIFETAFTAVRKNFSDVYTRFFGSGVTDLRLTEPGDILGSGVELIFVPPGKKISNKTLLSGGEKAVAALTLLFALFLYKPTPFCFLDEVDAPLDDFNTGKFINMLSLLAQDTQFVVITHKHLTMAAANRLYGITMQEGGVSAMLSVALEGHAPVSLTH